MTDYQKFDFGDYKTITENFQSVISKISNEIETFQKTISKVFDGFLEIPNSVKVLAEYGWYLPFDFHPQAVNKLVSEIEEDGTKNVDLVMIAYLDNEIKNIESDIIKKFPKRKAAIQAAIRAHKNKEYYLSIPVFFSQTEGICRELTGKRFFKVKQKPATIAWVSNFKSNSLMAYLLEPLKYAGPARMRQDPKKPKGINRHDVLHGDCFDYGKDSTNSYKAFSLLNYISDTVFEAKDYLEKNKNNA